MCGPGGRNPAARDDAANISTQRRDPAPWDHTVFFKRESRADTSRFYFEGVRRPLFNRLVARSDYIYPSDRSSGPSDRFVDPWCLYSRGYLETHLSQAQISPRNDQWGNHWRIGINFGAIGPLAMSAHPKENWLKEQIVANHAAVMACQHGLKVVAFTAIGVNLIEYSRELIGLVLGAATGTFVGTKILKRISDDRFRVLLNVVLTILALRMIYENLLILALG